MSWSSYTDSLVKSKVDMCAIHGAANGAPWAQVDKFKCSPDEVCVVTQAITRKDNNIYGTGAKLGGKKWTVIRLEDDDVLVMKGKDPDNQKQTLVVAVSGQAVVLGTSSDDNVQGPAVRKAVELMRDYLKSCGY